MLLSGKAKCFDCILVYYFEIKVSPFEKFHGPYGKTGLQSMIILQACGTLVVAILEIHKNRLFSAAHLPLQNKKIFL